MPFTIKPLPGKVLVNRIERTRSSGGIHYVSAYQDDEKQFRVLAVGPPRKKADGRDLAPVEVKAGDHVIVEMLGYERKPVDDGTGRLVIDAREIVAVVTQGAA